MTEKSIPGGWELSATLALFRNMALMDPFPPSKGEVYYSHSEAARIEQSQTFTNTYRFYRETGNGKFLELTVVEEHEMGEKPEGGYYHKVKDLSRAQAIVDVRPPDVDLPKDLSKLLGYIFDNREPLQVSEAGEMAKQLNYGATGRVRTEDYSQPRVSFLENEAGEVEKVRIHGLSTLLNPEKAITGQRSPGEDDVLEMSVDNTGVARVSLSPLKRR